MVEKETVHYGLSTFKKKKKKKKNFNKRSSNFGESGSRLEVCPRGEYILYNQFCETLKVIVGVIVIQTALLIYMI